MGLGAQVMISGHLLSPETPCQPGMWRKSTVLFPGRQVWVWGGQGHRFLQGGGAWEPANPGGHGELTNWTSPEKFGRGAPVLGLSPSKIHPGQSHPTSHPNSWRRGIRRARGSARRLREAPGPGGEAPPARVRGPGRRPNRLGRGCSRGAGAGYTKTAAEAPGLRPGPISGRPDLPSRRCRSAGSARPPARRGGGFLSQRGVP